MNKNNMVIMSFEFFIAHQLIFIPFSVYLSSIIHINIRFAKCLPWITNALSLTESIRILFYWALFELFFSICKLNQLHDLENFRKKKQNKNLTEKLGEKRNKNLKITFTVRNILIFFLLRLSIIISTFCGNDSNIRIYILSYTYTDSYTVIWSHRLCCLKKRLSLGNLSFSM